MSKKKNLTVILGVCIVFVATVTAYDYDSNDFAVEVVDYNQGTGIIDGWISGHPFDQSNAILGRPTVDTTGDYYAAPPSEPVPVVPVYPAFRAYDPCELVMTGDGGYITVRFNHPVRDDKNNPYGIDFIIFGNTKAVMDGSSYFYQNTDPCTVIISSYDSINQGTVSISQDGLVWFIFTGEPFADDFAPTLGRIYNPDEPDPNAFSGNLYWAGHTDPTLPIDPNLSFSDFSGKTLAQVCSLYYDSSAGGTGFDIDDLELPRDTNGLKWFQYVKIDGVAGTAVDAISDVSACGDYKHPFPIGDLNKDCRVDFVDIALLAQNWLKCTYDCD